MFGKASSTLDAPPIVSVSGSPALQRAEATLTAARTRLEEAAALVEPFKTSDLTLRAMRAREDHGVAKAEFEEAQAKAAEVRDVVVEAVQAARLPDLQDLVRELAGHLAEAATVNDRIVAYQAATAVLAGGRGAPSASFGALEAENLLHYWRQTARENGYLTT